MNNIEVELTEQELLDTLSSIKYRFDQLSSSRSKNNQCFTTLRNELIRLQRLYCYYGNVLLNRGGCYVCKREVIEESIEKMKNIKIDDTKGVITRIISDPKR